MSFQFLFENIPILLFAFARISVLIFTAPILNSRAIPALTKAGLALSISIVTVPYLVNSGYIIPATSGLFLLKFLGEMAIGVMMTLILQLYFAIYQLAGQLFTTQIGFAASQVFDPMGEIQLPLMGQFFNLAAMYLFLSIKGLNKLFFNGIFLSFIKITPENFLSGSAFYHDFILGSFGMIFVAAMQIAIPIMATLMVCSVTMGLLAKAAPQMNLLMLGFPINIMVGFTVLILIFPVMIEFFGNVINDSFSTLRAFLNAVEGSIA